VIRRFNRFELKYILPVVQCADIIDDLRHQIGPDRHGGSQGYDVVSLYYDSADYECFWAKIEGLKYRRKVRIRIYPGEDITRVSSAAVEIKQRINKTVQKRRLELPIEQAEELCAGRLELTGLDAIDNQVAQEVTYLSLALDLRPTAVTAYRRRAFEGQGENAGLRITFDTRVAARIHALKVNAAAGNRLVLADGWCIMEVKADERIPEWTTSLLARHACQLSRVSKYCTGVAQLKGFNVLPFALSPGAFHPDFEHGSPDAPRHSETLSIPAESANALGEPTTTPPPAKSRI
jgi:SPX domain protein involved in polyphosphate accumulation